MTRIILIVPSFPKTSETFIVSKVLGLLNRGWDMHVVCGGSDLNTWNRFPELAHRNDIHQRIHVAWPHRPRWFALLLIPVAIVRCLLAQPSLTWRYLCLGKNLFGLDILRRLYLDADLIVLKPDLVHFEFGTLAVGRTYLKQLLNCRIVVSFRGYDLNYIGLDNSSYYHEVWEQADWLHLLGEGLWQRAVQRGCSPDQAHALIAPAINATFFDPGEREYIGALGTPDHPMRILSVGRLEWKKGHEYALQAINLLLAQGIYCEYHIVGDGTYLEAVSFARHQLGLEKVVHLLGALSRTEVKSQMLWADVFLHAAVSEGFCNAVIEAQAMGLPVVCTDADGLAENVLDGRTGFVVPRRNSQALADALICLASDPHLMQQMREAGSQRVKTLFRLEDQIAAFERLYDQVLERLIWSGETALKDNLEVYE
jgi:colanic acid/amylovoran biosynthesis glycosyltransferase